MCVDSGRQPIDCAPHCHQAGRWERLPCVSIPFRRPLSRLPGVRRTGSAVCRFRCPSRSFRHTKRNVQRR
jgi:hypothetical protein